MEQTYYDAGGVRITSETAQFPIRVYRVAQIVSLQGASGRPLQWPAWLAIALGGLLFIISPARFGSVPFKQVVAIVLIVAGLLYIVRSRNRHVLTIGTSGGEYGERLPDALTLQAVTEALRQALNPPPARP